MVFLDIKSLPFRLKMHGGGGRAFLPAVVASLFTCLNLEVFLICKYDLKSKP